MKKVKNKNSNRKIFGQELMLDLFGCDLKVMQSEKKIKEFCGKICKLVKINSVGKTIIKNTGKADLKGYSACQFLETSSIVIHTCDPILETYINVFSCRRFNNKIIIDFTKKFFKAKNFKTSSLMR